MTYLFIFGNFFVPFGCIWSYLVDMAGYGWILVDMAGYVLNMPGYGWICVRACVRVRVRVTCVCVCVCEGYIRIYKACL